MSEKTIYLLPAEAVPVRFDISSLSSRIGAQLADIIITYGSLFLFVILLVYLQIINIFSLYNFIILAAFFIRTPYYIFAELVWNGQTLGKKLVKICVVSADGRTLTAYQIVVRNLLKEAEVFLPLALIMGISGIGGWTRLIAFGFLCITLFYPIFSKKNQRIGDVIANTIVVEKPKIVFLEDVAEQATKRTQYFTFDAEQLSAYGRYELQFLEDLLRNEAGAAVKADTKIRAAKAIHKRIKYTQAIPENMHETFLEDFYVQQRQFLEGRSLFGDVREDKNYQDKV